MIPVSNQMLTRAGPVSAVSPVGEAVGAVAQTNPVPGVQPVSQASAGDQAALDRDDAAVLRRAEAEIALPQKRATSRSAANTEAPQDRAVFRAKAIQLLTATYGEDESFQRALQLGTIVIHAIVDQTDSDMQPELTYALYRQGAQQSDPVAIPSGGSAVTTVGPYDFIAWWPK